MVLSPLEKFALGKLLDKVGISSIELNQDGFQVLRRERTSAGFFAVVQSPNRVEQLQRNKELCQSFTHHALVRGGYFMCWAEDDDTLCLEAVANKQSWPDDVSPAEICCKR